MPLPGPGTFEINLMKEWWSLTFARAPERNCEDCQEENRSVMNYSITFALDCSLCFVADHDSLFFPCING